MTTSTVLSVPSEDAMFDLLSALNVSGVIPELPCLRVASVGTRQDGRPNLSVSPFLATLTDPDADHVNYIYSDESGRSRCPARCENCGSEDAEEWSAEYPVDALVADWPDTSRCDENGIVVWWPTPEAAS